MYTEKDYLDNRAQCKRRMIYILVPAAVLLILTIVSFAVRWPVTVTTILCAVMCCGVIFSYSMFITPVRAYGKHVEHALHGRTRDIEGTFTVMENEAVGRDGVDFYPLTINVGDLDKEEDDRLFYYDANLPRPDWKSGDKLKITSYDNRVTRWEKL